MYSTWHLSERERERSKKQSIYAHMLAYHHTLFLVHCLWHLAHGILHLVSVLVSVLVCVLLSVLVSVFVCVLVSVLVSVRVQVVFFEGGLRPPF